MRPCHRGFSEAYALSSHAPTAQVPRGQLDLSVVDNGSGKMEAWQEPISIRRFRRRTVEKESNPSNLQLAVRHDVPLKRAGKRKAEKSGMHAHGGVVRSFSKAVEG